MLFTLDKSSSFNLIVVNVSVDYWVLLFLLYICVDFELGTLDDLHSFCLTVAVYLILLAKMCFLLIEEKKKKFWICYKKVETC